MTESPSPRRTTAETATLLLCGAGLADGRTVDVLLSGPRIEAVGTAGSLAGPASSPSLSPSPTSSPVPAGPGGGPARGAEGARIDLRGYLLLPAPAEPHAHLDLALTAGGPPCDDADDVQRRAVEAALLHLGHGTTAVRSHVHVGDVHGLRSLEAVLQARRSLRGLVDVQTVAVPRLLTGAAGADGLAMLRDALKMGAAAVGGCPDLDPDPSGYTEAVLALAAEFGLPVDLHTAADDPARLARLAAMAGGLRPGVALGPCHGLAALAPDVLARTAERLAAAGVSVTALPQGRCALERAGRAGPYAVAPVRTLLAAGVTVTAGSGALADQANPVGRADPLEAAYLLAAHGACSPDRAYDLVSGRARALLGLPEVRVEAGFPAELLAVRGDGLAAVLSQGYSRLVVHRGRVVSRTSAVREFCDGGDAARDAGLDLPRQSPRKA
ncbi:amidohydrolase family protein [Actinacidiphila yeochonensis]|uniref:amidohydrolase family protein n=1 Tax=Actinacidiphila yeochonensis TaxID=89050 RepID=UPI00055AD5CC|nr:amidohydrolase family protein [Actinacidiphila yeochonensis]